MIFQSQAVERILVESGQLQLDPTELGFTPSLVSRSIFVPAVREYLTRYRPNTQRTIKYSTLTSAEVPLPEDFINVIQVKPVANPIVPSGNYTLRPWRHLLRTRNETGVDYRVNVKDKTILLPWGTFSITYMSRALPTTQIVRWAPYETEITSSTFRFQVPCELWDGFTIQAEQRDFLVDEVTDVGTCVAQATGLDDPIDVSSFSVDIECPGEWTEARFINITFSRETTGPLYISGTASLPAAAGISLDDDEMFFLCFLVKFGHAYANSKQQLQMDEMPIDFNRDDFLQWVRQKEEAYERKKETGHKWWQGVG